MPRYISYCVVYILFFILAMALAPVLPMFAVMRYGPADNAHRYAIEPRLPAWLFWFDTSTDNSLWGDNGWRTLHCQKRWNTYWGMVLWLWRNPACGFAWSVLARSITPDDFFGSTSSGCGLNLDKGRGQQGWFHIRCTNGAFQYRLVRKIGPCEVSIETGWLLDIYLKDFRQKAITPKAVFQCQPRVTRWRK